MARGIKPAVLDGLKFGKLTVLRTSHTDGITRWELCRCDCGTELLVRRANLKAAPGTRSCGCSHLGNARHVTHGLGKPPEYNHWSQMKSRCLNRSNPNYPRYGGRGIRICDRWLNSFSHFYADMGPRPTPKHSIDRYPNNDGNYEPSNCRWATKKEQANNRRKAPPRPSHPNSLKNLRTATSEQMRHIWATTRAHEKVATPARTCERCGTSFVRAGKPRHARVYCSKRCGTLARHERAREPRIFP